MQRGDQRRDLVGGVFQGGHAAGLGGFQRDQMRMVGKKPHQVQLAQHPGHLSPVADHQPVDPVAQHQDHRLEQLGTALDRDGGKGRDLVQGDSIGGPIHQQHVAQVGGGKDAQPLWPCPAAPHQHVGDAGRRHLPAGADDVGRPVQKERLAHRRIPDARGDQGQRLAPGMIAAPIGQRSRRLRCGRARRPGRSLVFPGTRRRQCAEASDAPIPVSDRICWAGKPARSTAARPLLSVIEKNQIPRNASVIENSAGEV